MKKTLLNIALATVASAAFADQQTANFTWALQEVPRIAIQIVNGQTAPNNGLPQIQPFNAALGTLNSVSINVAGNTVTGSGSITSTEPGVHDFSGNLNGNHFVQVGVGGSLFNLATPLFTSASGSLNNGQVLIIPSVSVSLAGSAPALNTPDAASRAAWTGGNIPLFIRQNVLLSVGKESNVSSFDDSSIQSSGIGTITYNYTPFDNRVPEAETYVAGLALVGMAGYGFYRRSRKA